jgi:hypothetical protein
VHQTSIVSSARRAQAIATVPEFLWELSLGIYLTVKGFKASPILDETHHTEAGEASLNPGQTR